MFPTHQSYNAYESSHSMDHKVYSRKFPLMKNENRKRKLRKCFSEMQSPAVLMRAVLSSDKNQGWRLGNWSLHPGAVKTGTNKGWNEVKWLESTESVPHRCQWRRRHLYVLLITLIFYSSIYFTCFLPPEFHYFPPTTNSFMSLPLRTLH